jgi:hypothetical protein
MILFNYESKQYSIKNNISELSLGEFSKLNTVLTDETNDNVLRWCNVLELLGLPEEVIDELSINELSTYIQNAFKDNVGDNINPIIEIDGYTYECKMDGDVPKINVNDLKWIEKMIERGPNHLIAVIFKRTDLTKKEHFDKSHIELKSKLFAEHMPASQALFFLIHITNEINSVFKTFIEEDGQSTTDN